MRSLLIANWKKEQWTIEIYYEWFEDSKEVIIISKNEKYKQHNTFLLLTSSGQKAAL
jgi:hypothetical protein